MIESSVVIFFTGFVASEVELVDIFVEGLGFRRLDCGMDIFGGFKDVALIARFGDAVVVLNLAVPSFESLVFGDEIDGDPREVRWEVAEAREVDDPDNRIFPNVLFFLMVDTGDFRGT